jgi:putative membrane protein insertion efficiency factor
VKREEQAASGGQRVGGRFQAGLRAVFLAPLRFYSRFISPNLGRRCRYHPTCSAYAEQAIRELGVARGTILAAWRLLRCNPFSAGGYDPLEARAIFKPKPDEPAQARPTRTGAVT